VTDDRRDLLPLKVVRLAGHAAIQIVSACRIPANSSRLTAGPFAKQAYIHLFTRPICRAF